MSDDGWAVDDPGFIALAAVCESDREVDGWAVSGLSARLAVRARRAGLTPYEDGIERVTGTQIDTLLALRSPLADRRVLALIEEIEHALADSRDMVGWGPGLALLTTLVHRVGEPLGPVLMRAVSDDDYSSEGARRHALLLCAALRVLVEP